MAILGTLSFDTKLNAQAVKDAETIKKQVLHKLGNSIPLKLKVTFTSKDLRSDLQNNLNTFKPKVKVDIIVDQATASKAVQDALAKAGLSNNMTAGQLRAQRAAQIQQKMALDLAKAQRQAAAAADRHSKSMLTLNSHFGNGITLGGKFSATIASVYSVYTLKNFVQSMIEIGGEFQKQRIALETMLGSIEKADAMYERMKNLAVESPFTFMDLMSYTKQLKAFQIPYNELFDTTKRLGDISAGLGVDMNRLILAFGQVRSAAFLRGQEVRQFTEAGIPLVDALAKKFSELEKRAVSAGEVFDKISKRQVSFGMVKDVLWELTDEGGQFYNMQSKLTESLSGKLDKLRDSYQIMVAEMAQGNDTVLGRMLDIMTQIVKYGDKFIGVLSSLTTAYLLYKAAIVATNTVNKIAAYIEGVQLITARMNAIRSIRGLEAVTWRQVAAQQALNTAMSWNWAAIGIAAVATIIGLYTTFKTTTDELADAKERLDRTFQETQSSIKAEQSQIDSLFGRLRRAKEGTDEYKKVKDQIISQYGQYLNGLSQEIRTLQDVEAAYRAIARAARDAAIAEGKSEAMRGAQKSYGDRYSRNITNVQKALKSVVDDDTASRYIKKITAELKYFGNVTPSLQHEIYNLFEGKGANVYRPKILQYIQGLVKGEQELFQTTNLIEQRFAIDDPQSVVERTEKWWKKANKISEKYKQYAPKEDQDFEDYFEAIEKNLNSRKGLLDKMTKTSANYEQIKEEVEVLTRIFEDALGGNKESLSKFKSGGKKSDPLLDEYKMRLDSLDKFMQAYQRYAKEYSKADALNFAEELFPDFKGKGADVVQNYRETLLELSRISGSNDRKKFANSVLAKVSALDAEILKKEVDNSVKQLNKYIDEQSGKYDLYKKILEATGDRKQASTIAFGNLISYDNFAQELRDKIQEAISSMGSVKGFTIEQLLGMDDKELNEIGIFEKGLDGVYKMLQKLRDEEQKLKAEDVELFLDAIKNAQSLETELAQIELKYKRSREAIASKGGDRSLIDNTFKNEAAEKSKARWEWFKKTNDDWGRIFSNLDKISTKTLQHMIDKLEEQVPFIDDNVEAVKELYQAIDKLNDKLAERNPFAAIGESISKATAIKSLLKKIKNWDDYGSIFIDKETSKKTGIRGGWRNVGEVKKEGEDQDHQAREDFGNGLEGLVGKFKDVQDVLEPVITLFDMLGEEGLSKFFSMGSNALGAAAQTAKGLNDLGLGNLGPYGAAAAAALSIASSIFAMHDEALQEEIEASQQRQKEMENLTKNLEKALERTLGGIYNTKAGDSIIKSLVDEIRNPYAGIDALSAFGYDTKSNYKRYISEDTVKAVDNAKKTKTYYDAAYASMLAQRDELKHQMDSEEDKKDSDSSKISDYMQQIKEMEDEIENFAEDMAKALYDIDVKSWAQELGDALFEAWQKGESGADAFKKKASELMADLAKNIATTKLVETALQPVLNAVVDEMERTAGMLDEQSVNRISQQMELVGRTMPEAFTNLMDAMNEGIKKAGLSDLKELSEDAESSTGSAIKSLTEETGNILASYVNGIRADVSVIREMELIHLPSISSLLSRTSVLAEAQVTLQQQIAANTLRNAEAADKIYSLLHSVAPDGTRFQIK